MKKTLTACPYCGTGCMLYLISDDNGKLVGVQPGSSGQLCVKGWNAFNFVDHPDRLTVPMIRKAGVLEPASWDHALQYTVDRLRDIQARYGRDSIAFFSSAKCTNEENYLMMKLARAVFKTNNIDHCARLCHASTVTGLMAAFGSGAMTNSISCFEISDLFFVTGSNTTEQHPLIGTRILNSVRRGAKLIVADNRTIRLAHHADLHLRAKNGTDVALLNGIMHVIIKEDLMNREFIDSRTENFEEMRKTVERYTPQIASEITGVPADDIVKAARMFAGARTAMIVYSMGITQHTHGVDNVRSCANLAMLTGNVGRPGAGVDPLRGQNNVQGACDMGALPDVYTGYQKLTNSIVREKFEEAWGVKGLPDNAGLTMTAAINAAHEGKLKALYIMGENPVMSDPDQKHVREAFEKLEFVAVQDIFPTPTSEYAHVVLPASTYAEKDGTFTSTERRVQRVRQAVGPVGESRADWKILCELAARAGYNGMSYGSAAEIMDEAARVTPIYGGISYERIDKMGLQWPCTGPDHPGTPILHAAGFSRGKGMFTAVEYRPSAELPDADYPLILSTGRSYFHFHTGTMTRRTKLLTREEPRPTVEINDSDAKSMSIRDREMVLVATRRGEITAQAVVSDNIISGVIFMTFHFEEGAANALTNNALDPEAQIPEFKVCAARIRKIS